MATDNVVYLKAGDRLVFSGVCRDRKGPVDLTGCTARLIFRPVGASTPVYTYSLTVDPDQTNNKGRVTYTGTDSTSGITSGEYVREVEVTMPSLAVRTFPNAGYDELQVTAQLA
jgi:hypothetical protein